jgi:glycosyltransferase involved in cell wall biosynthesis
MPGMSGPLSIPSPLERDLAVAEAPAPAPVAAMARPAAVRKPHICFVALSAWPVLSGDNSVSMVGGAEVQQSVIAPALAERGYQVSMITLDHGQPEGVVVRGVKVFKAYRPEAGIPVARFIHPRMTSLWDALKRVDADVYYQRTAAVSTGITAAFCRRFGRHGIYAGASDVDFVPGKQDIEYARDRKIFEWGLRRMHRVFVQNTAQLEHLRANYGLDGVLIPNCFAPPQGAPAGRQGSYVLWVATVRPSKRPELMLELARRMPEHRFVMIGGPDPGQKAREYFESVREAAAAIPNLEFKGYMPFTDAERWFDGARVMVNTSLYEGFPNTFLQSWSRGVPTVAFIDTGSRLDGAPVYDIVADVNDMAWKVDRLMREDILWEQSSQRAEAFYRRAHSVEAIVGHYERELARVPLRAA